MLVVPIFERQAAGRLPQLRGRSSTPTAALLGVYRKMHIPDDPLFNEKYYFTPGDAPGFRVWQTRYATIGVLICWDQWYPEAARITSLMGAQVLFYPTAIGWHPSEQDEWGAAQVDAWRTIQRSHAIANGVYVAAPNRIGHEDEPGTDGLNFFGRSFIADPFGRYRRRGGRRRRDPDRALRSGADRDGAPQLAVPARSPHRRLRADSPALPRMSRRHSTARAGACRPSGSRTARPGSRGRITSRTGRASSRRFPWVYGEIARVLADFEPVEILCHSEPVYENARRDPREPRACARDHIRLHLVPNDRTWLRDSAPTGVVDAGGRGDAAQLVVQRAGRSTPTGALDAQVGRAIAEIAQLPRVEPTRPDNGAPMVLEGGGIEVNGAGLLLVTEEWLLSGVQVRNPGLTREGYDEAFREWLGARKTIWLGEGCAGDDTHGHIDDIARFVAPDTVVLAVEEDPADENHARSMDNVRRLELASRDPQVGPLQDRAPAVSAPRAHERRAAAGELRQLLHRQRRRAGADVQRSERSRGAEHPGGADAAPPDRRHPRRRSGLGPRHASLPDAAGAAGVAPRRLGLLQRLDLLARVAGERRLRDIPRPAG